MARLATLPGDALGEKLARRPAMLATEPRYTSPTELDRKVFELLIPVDHYLRRAARVIDFERFRPLMVPCYSPDLGRPALEPVVLLKLEFLQYHDRLEVFVPVVREPPTEYFTAEDFHLDEAGEKVTCPAGQQSSRRDRSRHDTGWVCRFRHSDCFACALPGKCTEKLPKSHGRSVLKNDYAAEYAAARAKALTPEFDAVRREHRKVERKLGEMVRHHRGRRARYRGLPKVLLQQLMTGIVVNVKRMVRILCANRAPARA